MYVPIVVMLFAMGCWLTGAGEAAAEDIVLREVRLKGGRAWWEGECEEKCALGI